MTIEKMVSGDTPRSVKGCGPCTLLMSASLEHRDALNLYHCAERQSASLDCGASGRRVGVEILLVNVVHRGEVAHVCEEYSGLHHVVEGATSRPKDRAQVLQHLACLLGHAAFNERTGV